jgi:hypothetical protein
LWHQLESGYTIAQLNSTSGQQPLGLVQTKYNQPAASASIVLAWLKNQIQKNKKIHDLSVEQLASLVVQ